MKRKLEKKIMRNPFKKFLITLLAIFICVSCAHTVAKEDHDVVLSSTQFDESLLDSYNIDYSLLYRIMPGDILELLYHFRGSLDKVFTFELQDIIAVKFPLAPELNEQQKIRPDGKITLPYIGDVTVVGYTPDEIKKKLKDKFAKVINEPELYVVAVEYGGAINELKESIRNRDRGQSKLITVRSDGYVTLPLVGEVKAAGKTIPEMTEITNKKYHMLTEDLHVDLILNRAEGSRICVLGEVNRPGYYKIDQPLNVFQAVALGGGFNDNANRSSVLTIRKAGNKIKYKVIDVNRSLSSDPQGVLTLLTSRDIVYVPKTTTSNIAKVARDIADIFFFRGWGFTFGYDLNDDF